MSSPVLSQDLILEVFSYLPAKGIAKLRLLNKDCNKKSYESWFLHLNLRRTNSISGYFLQHYKGYFYTRLYNYNLLTSFIHESRDSQKNGISIDFLPQGMIKIKACDPSHGILLCVDYNTEPKPRYVVCKPTTKEYQVIPNSEVNGKVLTLALSVIGLNPFRYKILRISIMENRWYYPGIFTSEVFDSGSFIWKRSKHVHPLKTDDFPLSNPVQASGFLHWLSWKDNVIRFCLKTETWSILEIPKFGVFPKLVTYEGKLGVMLQSDDGEGQRQILWVLKSSFKNSWEKVKEIKMTRHRDDNMWTPSNEAITVCTKDRLCFYDLNKETLDHTETLDPTYYNVCFRFCSDFEKVLL